MITSNGSSVLFQTLKDCDANVSYLSISFNNIDDTAMNSLGEYVQYNQHLETVRMAGNNISDDGIEILSEQVEGPWK